MKVIKKLPKHWINKVLNELYRRFRENSNHCISGERRFEDMNLENICSNWDVLEAAAFEIPFNLVDLFPPGHREDQNELLILFKLQQRYLALSRLDTYTDDDITELELTGKKYGLD